jgi:hypothetical protein
MQYPEGTDIDKTNTTAKKNWERSLCNYKFWEI